MLLPVPFEVSAGVANGSNNRLEVNSSGFDERQPETERVSSF